MKTGKKIMFMLGVVIFLSSCVSMKKFNDIKNNLTAENEQLKLNKMQLEATAAELGGRVEQLGTQNQDLRKQLDDARFEMNLEKRNKTALEKEIADLQNQLKALNTGSSAEIEKLLNEVNSREYKLRDAEKELQERNAKLIELQNILAQKEQAVKDLKNKVMNALTGFNNNGLTVHEKNGKVYVSLDEKLLFKTGKWDVDPNGQRAIQQLGEVLAQNPDISIMVEGHTDDVTMRGSGDVKDNWDLSVMRATAVTKILTRNKAIDPKRIISAGRSEYLPLSPEKTQEGRQINRRTEIILTPNLDELLKIIEVN
jgi:chemotaxis protein MotB